MAAAGQLLNNPMMSAAAMHYGSELAQRSQAYVDQGVSALSLAWYCVSHVLPVGEPHAGDHQSQELLRCGHKLCPEEALHSPVPILTPELDAAVWQ